MSRVYVRVLQCLQTYLMSNTRRRYLSLFSKPPGFMFYLSLYFYSVAKNRLFRKCGKKNWEQWLDSCALGS